MSKDWRYGTRYVESIDTYVDKSISDLIQTLNEQGYKTSYSCSGVLREHYSKDQLSEKFGDIDDAFNEGNDIISPYIRFKPQYHTTTEEDNQLVDKEYYKLKTSLTNDFLIVLYNNSYEETEDNLFHINAEFSESNHPYQDNDYHSYTLRVRGDSLNMLYYQLDGDYKLYDKIVELIFYLLEIGLDYTSIIEEAILEVNLNSKDIRMRIAAPLLPTTFNESPADIQKEMILNPNTGEEEPYFDVVGDPEDVIQSLCYDSEEGYYEDYRTLMIELS